MEEKPSMGESLKTVQAWKTWKTIVVTDNFAPERLLDSLVLNQINLGFEVLQFLEVCDFAAPQKNQSVDLVKLSVSDLGYQSGATRKTVFSCAEKEGLKLCPNFMGPLLCLQYLEQPKGDRIVIASASISLRSQSNLFFLQKHVYTDGIWLEMVKFSPNDFCQSGDEWIFCRY